MRKKRIIIGLIVTLCLIMQATPVFAYRPNTIYFMPKDSVTSISNPERNYLIVVNHEHPINLNGSFVEDLQRDLVYMPNVVDGDTMAVEKAAYLAFTRLQRDLETEDGIRIGLYDGYRTADDQEYLLSQNLTNTAAKVGYSEHHTGLVLDIVLWHSEDGKKYEWYSETVERQKTIPEFKKIHEKMVDYGFIERYPNGKQDITGIEYIPYEIRFVGSSQIAHAITDNNLCLEEFVGMN
ncbi:M15 family metallopeptidase [Candidatus Saccharibacteria bacterium]|nr:M15 family metallopeptidase [Candidatus Saccharibacteria bacterium]